MQLKLIKKYLAKIGIEPETTQIYIELTKLGPTSALQLAKATGISRTQVYRHLEELQKYGLVSGENLNYGSLFRPMALDNIEGLIANREAENAALRRNLGAMTKLLQNMAGATGPKATVQHYYGVSGLKQVNWNLTKANKEYRVFEVAHLSQHLDKAFARHCRERYIERKLTSFDLTNATRVVAKNIEPFAPARTHFRHIDPEVLTINFEVYIYNDVVTLLDYHKDKLLALEIYHASLNHMMKQLFDAMWQTATPIEISQ